MNRFYCPFDGCLSQKGHSQKYFMSAKNAVIHCFEKHSVPAVENVDEEYPITNDYIGVYLKQIVKYKSKRMEGRTKFRCTHEDCHNRLFKTGGIVIAHYAKNHLSEKQCQGFFATLSAEFSGIADSTADEESEASEDEEDVPAKQLRKKPATVARPPATVARPPATVARPPVAQWEDEDSDMVEDVEFGSEIDGEVQSRSVSRSASVASSVCDPLDLDDLETAMDELRPKKKTNKKKKVTMNA